MSKKDDTHYLVDMLVNAQLVSESARGVSRQQFDADREKQDSVAFRISIIGEAARYVTEPTRLRIPQLPWPKITGMRHRIAHEYSEIDQDVVWRVATVYVPELLEAITSFLATCGIDLSDPAGPSSSADPNAPKS
jgi:uncharacterized protein with HEPN domain